VASDIFFSPAGGVFRAWLPLYQPIGMRGMPAGESAAGCSRGAEDRRAQIAQSIFVEKFMNNFNVKITT
jgi:hypothetical protein